MQPFRKHTGLVVPLDKVNVDTDQIIPKQFLKRIERTGFGQFLFHDWRFSGDEKDLGKEFKKEFKKRPAILCSTRRATPKPRFWSQGKISAADHLANMPCGR